TDLGQDLEVAALDRQTRECDLDHLRLGKVRKPARFQLGAPGGERLLDRPLDLVDGLAEGRPLLGVQRTDALEKLAHAAALATEVLDLDPLELGCSPGFA